MQRFITAAAAVWQMSSATAVMAAVYLNGSPSSIPANYPTARKAVAMQITYVVGVCTEHTG